MPLNPLLTRLDIWLKKHRSRFFKNLNPGASAAELAALAKSLGKPLPAEVADLLSWHNGQGDDYVGYFVDHWLLLSTTRIAAAKADLDANGTAYGWNKDWLPLMDDDGGNYLTVDLAHQPAPLLAYWMGETPETLAPSLEKWLTTLVTAVEAGQYSQDSERGTFSKAKKR